jgi:hypothetical protein
MPAVDELVGINQIDDLSTAEMTAVQFLFGRLGHRHLPSHSMAAS